MLEAASMKDATAKTIPLGMLESLTIYPEKQADETEKPKQSSKVDAHTMMAPAFVPREYQRIFETRENNLFRTQALPNGFADFERLFYTSVRLPTQKFVPPWVNLPGIVWDPYFLYSPRAAAKKSPSYRRDFKDVERNISSLVEYHQIFCDMLLEEYEEKILLYNRYTQYNLIPTARFFGSKDGQETSRSTLEIAGIFDARPPLQFGDKVILRPMVVNPTMQPLEILATVVNIVRGKKKNQKDRVIITWLNNVQSAIFLRQPMAVRFYPSTVPFDRCLVALKWLLSDLGAVASKGLLFPSQHPNVNAVPLNLVDPEVQRLNSQQLQFIHLVLSRSACPTKETVRAPMILTGPAGTGKTQTLLMALVKCLDQDLPASEPPTKRILICTPSHTACDVVTRRISKHLPGDRIFRLYDTSRPVETVPVEMLAFARQNATGDFVLPLIDTLRHLQVIVCTCSDAHLLVMSGMTNKSLRTRKQELANFCKDALESSGMKVPSIAGVEKAFFSHLFLDEAAQATEPETMIPLSVVVDDAPGIEKAEIVLSGDPRQLNSDIYSQFAGPGLQKSFLERLLRLPDFGGRGHLMGPPTKDTWSSIDELIEYSFQGESSRYLAVFLTLSYRGHPSFLHIPSRLFYLNKLKSDNLVDESEDNKWCQCIRRLERKSRLAYACSDKKFSWPLHFVGVRGSDTSLAVESFWGSNSWCNKEEAETVADIVQSIHADGISTRSIGVMAAFRAQVLFIRRLLRQRNLEAINVGMVEDYQAVESDVIVLSLTRSNDTFVKADIDRNSGLFQQPKRVNVALTRAEKLLVVVGNPTLMRKDKLWSVWLDYCRENGLWYGASLEGQ